MDAIIKGGWCRTPRFGMVKLEDVLDSKEALELGYTEPTHYEDPVFDIRGKSVGPNKMVFAAVRR